MKAELVYGYDAQVAEWVIQRLPYVSHFTEPRAIGVVLGNELIAGVVYSNHRPQYRAMEIDMAADSPQWAKAELIYGLLAFPFIQAGCYKVRACVRADKKHAITTFKHVGFIQEGILGHEFGPKQHAVIMRMTLPDFERIYGGIRDEAVNH